VVADHLDPLGVDLEGQHRPRHLGRRLGLDRLVDIDSGASAGRNDGLSCNPKCRTMIAVTTCFFASDLHGSSRRWDTLLTTIEDELPTVVFLGGDLFPGLLAGMADGRRDFLGGVLVPKLRTLRQNLADRWPRIVAILGNDDGAAIEPEMEALDQEGLLTYAHGRCVDLGSGFQALGYSYVPPTPFLWKDWERYDVSRFVDPGCVSPEEGRISRDVSPHDRKWSTIAADLDKLAPASSLESTILLAHSPPYQTHLDRAALDGQMVDHVPVDVHVGSIAIRRFIEARQPLLSLHGHIHESARLTGDWRDRIGRTVMMTAAHDGPELALVRFSLDRVDEARRELI